MGTEGPLDAINLVATDGRHPETLKWLDKRLRQFAGQGTPMIEVIEAADGAMYELACECLREKETP